MALIDKGTADTWVTFKEGLMVMDLAKTFVDLCVVTCCTAALRHLHVLLVANYRESQLKCELSICGRQCVAHLNLSSSFQQSTYTLRQQVSGCHNPIFISYRCDTSQKIHISDYIGLDLKRPDKKQCIQLQWFCPRRTVDCGSHSTQQVAILLVPVWVIHSSS